MRASNSKSALETDAPEEEEMPISSRVFRSADAGSGQTVFLLEAFDCFGGLGAVIAGDFAGEVTPGFESGLYFADLLSTGAVLG